MTKKVRVRFAPSPTGPLHIGGLRTALFNYFFAKQNGGDFILRFEDTDQNRYVEGSENHIVDSLEWCGIKADESPIDGGDFGPYRQSERKELYKKRIDELIEKKLAYYAFDSKEDLATLRTEAEKEGKVFSYSFSNRLSLRNSLSLSKNETLGLLKNGAEYVVRFKTPENKEVVCRDELRGVVHVSTKTIDDKILFKSDGMPTYHFANVVDDYEMEISHVIRGEEWLPSLPLHWLLYDAFGWEIRPKFVHLPLILKPEGKGKLSKRDGDKFGFPVFAVQWKSEEIIKGYKEHGFLPEAVINFLSLLGWNPGSEKELFSLQELIESFSLKGLNKSGARFDPEKNKWFNHAHIQKAENSLVIEKIEKEFSGHLTLFDKEKLNTIVELIKPRLNTLNEIYSCASFFFKNPNSYNEKHFNKLKKVNFKEILSGLIELVSSAENLNEIKPSLEVLVKKNEWNFGKVMGLFRLSLVGDLSGPDLFSIVSLLGKETCNTRMMLLSNALEKQ
ncbi:glutamate--tRNA ligase [Flavobacteriaceae bacterium]|nr:glutamate--tRNA ligase [Flavobacteriaceae bacterium]